MWPDPTKDPADKDIKNILDADDYSEIMRRVPGFLAVVSGLLQPLLDPAKLEKEQQQAQLQAQYVLSQLLQHLNCNANYYIQRFLNYLATATRNQAIVDLASAALALPAIATKLPQPLLPGDFDLDRAFVDKQRIIVPTIATLTDDQITNIVIETGYEGPPPSLPPPDSVDLDVPADGIHVEVAEGACKLSGIPVQSTTVDISLQGAHLSVTGPAQQ